MTKMALLPWLLSLLAAVLALGMRPPEAAAPSGLGEGDVWESGAVLAVSSPNPVECGELYTLSERAAALTGSLALVDRAERPARARAAAARIRGLAVQAAFLNGGEELAGVLEELADGLEGYAGGDPAGLAAVREASASNRRLRAAYAACDDTKRHTQNGGEGNE